MRVAHRRQLDAGGLQPGDEPRPGVPGGPGAADRLGRDARLLPRRRHQSVDPAPVFRTVADRVDRRVGRAHLVVHDDAAVDLQASLHREVGVRTDPAGDHQQVRRELGTVLEPDAADPGVADDLRRHRVQAYGHTELRQRLDEDPAGIEIELTFHQVTTRVHDRHGQPPLGEGTRGFQSEQATTEHHDLAGTLGGGQDLPAVGQGTEGHRTVQERRGVGRVRLATATVLHPQPVDGRNDGAAAGRENERLVARSGSVGRQHRLAVGVDRHHVDAHPQVEGTGWFDQRKVVLAHLAGQQVRQQDPVVRPARLGPEHHDRTARLPRPQLGGETRSRHAVPHHDDTHDAGLSILMTPPSPGGRHTP